MLSSEDTLKQDRREPERTCIVTRASCDRGQLIRFVADPSGVIVPDLAMKLPGRGIWVTASADMLQQAVQNNHFPRAAKQGVTVPDDLGLRVQAAMLKRVTESLAMARKAGQAIQGFDKVKAALNKDEVLAILHATEATHDGRSKLRQDEVFSDDSLSRDQLSGVFGVDNATHVAVLRGKAGEKMLRELRRFTGFTGKTPL